MPPQNQNNNDIFQHDRWVKLESSHEILERPDKFAEYFDSVCGSQAKVKEVFRRELLLLLRTDVEGKDELKALIRIVDKEDWRRWIKKIGLVGWSLILFFGGIVAKALLDKYIQ